MPLPLLAPPSLPALPDLDSPTAVLEWLATDDPEVTFRSRGWPQVTGYAVRYPAPAVLCVRLAEALDVPRRTRGMFRAARFNPHGWEGLSPVTMLARWAYAGVPNRNGEDFSSLVARYVTTHEALSRARQAARDGARNRGHLRDLTEALAGLPEAAMTEYRDTRTSLARWVDGWEPAGPQRPSASSLRGNSWR